MVKNGGERRGRARADQMSMKDDQDENISHALNLIDLAATEGAGCVLAGIVHDPIFRSKTFIGPR